jgi:hypothetical protein
LTCEEKVIDGSKRKGMVLCEGPILRFAGDNMKWKRNTEMNEWAGARAKWGYKECAKVIENRPKFMMKPMMAGQSAEMAITYGMHAAEYDNEYCVYRGKEERDKGKISIRWTVKRIA